MPLLDDDDPDDTNGPVCGPRTIAQRRADFLGDLAHLFLRHANTEAGAPVATVDVIVDGERLGDVCDCGSHDEGRPHLDRAAAEPTTTPGLVPGRGIGTRRDAPTW